MRTHLEGIYGLKDLTELPRELIVLISAHLDAPSLVASLLVSRQWRRAFGRGVRSVAPKDGLLLKLPLLFPGLESLSLDRSTGSAVDDAALAAYVLPLHRLTRLSLRHAALTANGCQALSQLHCLRELDLSSCKRLSSRGLAALPSLSLRRLHLDYCELLGDGVLDHVGSMTALVELSLRGCTRICGHGFVHLGQLQALTSLDLSALPDLSDAALTPLSSLTSLQRLMLDKNNVTGLGLTSLAPLQCLHTLSLFDSVVLDATMPAIGRLEGLTQLSLAYASRITDFGLAALSCLHQLAVLNMRGCESVRGEAFSVLAQSCSRLVALDVSNVPRLTEAGIQALCTLTSLRELWLVGCGLNNRKAEALRTLTGLRSLSVANSPDITATGVQAIVQGCRSLTRLDINGCRRVNDDCLAALAELPELMELNLGGAKELTNAGLAKLAEGATALHELNLACSDVSSIEALGALPHLRHVNVHGSRCCMEMLASLLQPSSPLCLVKVVPPWKLGQL